MRADTCSKSSWVQTELGNTGAEWFGFESAPLSINESVVGMEKLIGAITKESHGGKLWGHDGQVQQW